MANLEIVGVHEAATILGISPPTFSHLRARAKQKGEDNTDFPSPYVELKCGPIWLKRDIDKFSKVYKPVVRAKPGQGKSKKSEATVTDINEAKARKTSAAKKAPAAHPSAKAPAKTAAAKKATKPVKKISLPAKPGR